MAELWGAIGYGLMGWLVLGAAAIAIGDILGRLEMARSAARRRANPSSDAARLKARLVRMKRPTLLLTPAGTPGFSKMGGDPNLPAHLAWPMADGRPMTFAVQIDLAALGENGPDWAPKSGCLFAFFDEARYGFADQVKVLYSAENAWESGVETPPGAKRLKERYVAMEPYESIPSLDWLNVDLVEANLDDAELDELAMLPDEPFGDELQHRVGGYPSEIQGGCLRIEAEYLARGLPEPGETDVPPAIDRASRQWRLLLQIDSDPDLGVRFGDGGRLYVFIRERHALAGDFSQTVTLSQWN